MTGLHIKSVALVVLEEFAILLEELKELGLIDGGIEDSPDDAVIEDDFDDGTLFASFCEECAIYEAFHKVCLLESFFYDEISELKHIQSLLMCAFNYPDGLQYEDYDFPFFLCLSQPLNYSHLHVLLCVFFNNFL